MTKTMTAPSKNGAAVKNTAKKTTQNVAEKRAEEIARKIQDFATLKKKVHDREKFQEKLDELTIAEKAVSDNDSEEWENSKRIRVSMEVDRRDLLSFSNTSVIKDFLEFMRTRIEKKVNDLDDQILKLSV